MRLLHAIIIATLASTLVLETAFAEKLPGMTYADGTVYRVAKITEKVPVYNNGYTAKHGIRTCSITKTPIYSNTQGEALGSIFGMILGGLLGAKAGGDTGALTGAIVGGVVGNQASADPNAQRTIVGYRERKHCTTSPVKNRGDWTVLGYIYGVRDLATNQKLAPIGSVRYPSQKNYNVGQQIQYRAGYVYN
tara:strand:- start:260 stop:835 length:576 start_codon:yes stop_codon:yes gene_type:complete